MSKESIDFGVCRLSLVPMRVDPSHKAEQVSQLLFGDHYEVIEISKDKRWLKISVYYDGCEGWIDERQHHAIPKEHYEYINRADFKITTDLATSILYNKSPLLILIGSIIPFSSSELFKMEEQFAFNGDSKSLGLKRDAEFLKVIAMKYLNTPFQWGGKSSFGIDASGLTQMTFKINGYRLARTVQEQTRQGKEVKGIENSLPGDLAFFTSKNEKDGHVGILLGKEKVIHSYGRVRVDHINDEGLFKQETNDLTHQLVQIRRILPE